MGEGVAGETMKFAVLVFPGSNCDHDCYHALKHVVGVSAEFLWHKEESLAGFDGVVIPGGFSYGDYLRCGAIARFSPIMKAVEAFAQEGGSVIGICNGFQILVEAGLLPGALIRNRGLKFICADVNLRVETTGTPYTAEFKKGEVLTMPIAHAEGNYVADPETLEKLKRNDQVVFRYCDAQGNATDAANPNGAMENIAGIVSERRNVLGMMPHPDRCAEEILGGGDGLRLFRSMVGSLSESRV